ncbi:MAG: pyruvate dehydrogenase (acetyl-transferring), homodimeric type, partial [Aeromonas sobria]
MSDILKNDVDPIETLEWLASLESLLREEGPQRAQFILEQLAEKARISGVDVAEKANRDYINTIPASDEPAYPGDLEMERRIRAIIRWNAMMIVLRASKKDLDLGGHMSSFASSATIYDVCFNHFFRDRNEKDGGDLVYF